jgi:hypothetical protein
MKLTLDIYPGNSEAEIYAVTTLTTFIKNNALDGWRLVVTKEDEE